MTLIYTLVAFVWGLSAVIDYSEFCYLWQLKEYRWDKFKDFLSTSEGKRYWVRRRFFGRLVAAMMAAFWPADSTSVLYYLLFIFLSLDIIVGFYAYNKSSLRRPIITKKATLILLGSMFLEGLLIILLGNIAYSFLIIALRFIIISLVVFILYWPTLIAKKYYVIRATRKLSRYKDLRVIGITGSYGKSSVKLFLDHILKDKFKVLTTPKNINTEIGIAKFIIEQDLNGVNFLIAEMGAYRIGEINLICDMLKPKVGILTAVNEAHLNLFGSLEKTCQAKYELLRSIPEDGLAIVNSDNDYCRSGLGTLQTKIQTFGYDEEYSPTCLVEDVKSFSNDISVKYLVDGETWEVNASVRGEHNSMNLAACLLASRYLGVNKEYFSERSRSLEMPHNALRTYNYGRSTIIDDSYNSNPEGFRSALHFLAKYPDSNKKIIITRGILELGDKAWEIHEQIGGEIAFCADVLIIIDKEHERAFRKGVGDKYKTEIITKFEHSELLEYLKSIKETDAVILLENRMPAMIYKELEEYYKK